MRKVLISIVGPTTVGKSTFASTLLDTNKNICPIALYCVREKRADDDPRLTIAINESEYHRKEMFLDDYPYGIPLKDIDNFIESESIYGLSIGTPRGISIVSEKLSCQKYNFIERCNVVMTLTDNLNDELSFLSNRIDTFFPDKKKNEWRKKHHLKFVKDYFHNADYITKNCDIKLIQKHSTVEEWYEQLEAYLQLPDKVSKASLKRHATKNMLKR